LQFWTLGEFFLNVTAPTCIFGHIWMNLSVISLFNFSPPFCRWLHSWRALKVDACCLTMFFNCWQQLLHMFSFRCLTSTVGLITWILTVNRLGGKKM
jgi:hypothetical protein